MKIPFRNLLPARFLQRASGSPKRSLAARRGNTTASRTDWPKLWLGLATIVVLSVLMSVHLLPDKISLPIGGVSSIEVHASRSVNYVNSEATTRLQQAAALGTRPVYDMAESAVYDADHTVQEVFDRLARERTHLQQASSTNTAALPQSLSDMQMQFHGLFTRTQLKMLLTLSTPAFEHLRDFSTDQVATAMDRDLRDRSDMGRQANDVADALEDIGMAARAQKKSADIMGIVKAVAGKALRPNHILNAGRTLAAREVALRSVRPVYEHITRGEKILSPGETVTQEHLDKFTALGLRDPHLELTTGAAICILAAVMVLLVVYTIKHNLPALYADHKRLALLAVIVCLSVFGLKLGATMLGMTYGGGQPGYLGMMSVVAAAMLVSVLIDRQLAFLIAALLSVQTGLIMNHEIRFTVMTLMSSLVGIISASPVRSRTNLVSTTFVLACANVTLVWLMGLLLRDALPELLNSTLWAIASAGFAAFLFWFGVLALEKPFHILTHTTLLEMCASDRPLLKQLCVVAPGTYAHSIMVGTLAEAGAQAVGADALLCRVGGYYHDIGKMNNPDFFVENQRRENVHCRLSPSLSALIITGHVRNGIELAVQHKLPKEIRDIIAQHHGTTLISYFYHRALADSENENVPPGLEDRFRYPGPKPQTREAAIVMLADSIEAATRCLDKPTPERLEAEITKIVRGKIEDQQFDACSLTFRDIKGITDAFQHVLSAMMHGRIHYPSEPPRTATRLPMEVSRPDLRHDPGPVIIPSLPVAVQVETTVLYEGRPLMQGISLDPEAVHSPQAGEEPYGVLNTFGAVGAFDCETDPVLHPTDLPGSNTPRIAPLRSCSPFFVEPEVLYGRTASERTDAPAADAPPASGSPSPAPGGGPASRRSKRSSDG